MDGGRWAHSEASRIILHLAAVLFLDNGPSEKNSGNALNDEPVARGNLHCGVRDGWGERIFDSQERDPHPAPLFGHFIRVRAHVVAPVWAAPCVETRDAPCRRISAAPREASGK